MRLLKCNCVVTSIDTSHFTATLVITEILPSSNIKKAIGPYSYNSSYVFLKNLDLYCVISQHNIQHN